MEFVAEFFNMGGYAIYVWPSYGLTTVVLAGLLAVSLHGLRAREAALAGPDGKHG